MTLFFRQTFTFVTNRGITLGLVLGLVSGCDLSASTESTVSPDVSNSVEASVPEESSPGAPGSTYEQGLVEPHNIRGEKPLQGELHNVPLTTMNRIEGGNLNAFAIAAYWLDITEVIAAQYADCVAAHVCPEPGLAGDWSATYGIVGRTNMPVNEVSWFNARTYCLWVGKRLPTANEWEWAARGREEARLYPWGNEQPNKTSACWLRWDETKPRGEGPCDVGQSNVSRDGIYDMAGNVWEWTLTPGPNGNTVVLKGGAWYNDDPTKLLAASEGRNSPYDRSAASDGFRCASSLPAEQRFHFPTAPVYDH